MFVRFSMKSASAAGAAIAAAGMLLAPATASAQSYGYGQPYGASQPYSSGQTYGQNRYDDRSGYGYQDRGYADQYCRNDRSNRQGAGAAIGATLGAVAGSQMASRGRRTEGSILGGVLGAVVGASVASSARDCGPSAYDYRYDQSGYGYQAAPYDDRYSGYDRYDDRSRYDDRYDDRNRGYQGADSYGCRTVSTQIRDRYGRVTTRYEQSCPNRY